MWSERNKVVFDNEEISVHRMETSLFLFLIYGLGLIRIANGPCTLMQFVEVWIRAGGFFCFLLFLSHISFEAPLVYFLYTLGCPLAISFFFYKYIPLLFPIKKYVLYTSLDVKQEEKEETW